ncbi:MAG: hypothetical protein H0V17_05840 [Deltaproteobacteria bacterium]|nr:hypothetical protein [Deltaproteobacteria bacterium]
MGRLDDIIERNKNPKTSFRKSKVAASSPVSSSKPSGDDGAGKPIDKLSSGDQGAGGEDRLARIVARNQRANTGLKRRRLAMPATNPTAPLVFESEHDPKVGRLDRIIARNKNPDANYRWLKVGLAGVVLFVVLVLLIFTDLAAPPQAAYPTPSEPAAKPSGVGGVKLWKQPKKSGSAEKAQR